MMKGGEDFFFWRGKTAILLLHGFSSTPQEIRELGEYLANENITVRAPLLKGHGTRPDDLRGIKWQEWLNQAEREYARLKKEYTEVWIGGSSLGGNIALMAASRLKVAGVISMGAPVYFKYERLSLIAIYIFSFFKKTHYKKYPPNVDKSLIDKKVHYWSYPTSSLKEAVRCIRSTASVLPKVTAPALVMQSDSDHMLTKKNAEYIYSSLSSKKKSLKWVPNSYHVFTIDRWKESAFKEILKFIREN